MSSSSFGITLFMLGGLAGATFYLPLRKVQHWAWESYWFVYALIGLVVAPWSLAIITTPNLLDVLGEAPPSEVIYCLICGAFWGVGGLTWGLMIRYLGVGLGLAMGAGLASAAGTLVPPMLKGRVAIENMFATKGGQLSVAAALVSLVGIACVGWAGKSKEAELSQEAKKKVVAEFDFRKGVLVAILAGLMSSAMSFGLQGGGEIQRLACDLAPKTSIAWAGMPVLVLVLFGGFVVNGCWCIYLGYRNHSLTDYIGAGAPFFKNYAFAGIAGIIWCCQFICFKLGEPKMGKTSYVGWAVLMASSILFSQLLGIILGEWKGASGKTKKLLAAGLLFLIVSAAIAAYSGAAGAAS